MRKMISLLAAIFGALLLLSAHESILAGKVRVYSRSGSFDVLFTDFGFWFHAGMQFSFSLMVIIVSLMYLVAGRDVLPKVDKSDPVSYDAPIGAAVGFGVLFGLVLMVLLPFAYSK